MIQIFRSTDSTLVFTCSSTVVSTAPPFRLIHNVLIVDDATLRTSWQVNVAVWFQLRMSTLGTNHVRRNQGIFLWTKAFERLERLVNVHLLLSSWCAFSQWKKTLIS